MDYIRPCGQSDYICGPSASREANPCAYIYISQNVNRHMPRGLWIISAHVTKASLADYMSGPSIGREVTQKFIVGMRGADYILLHLDLSSN